MSLIEIYLGRTWNYREIEALIRQAKRAGRQASREDPARSAMHAAYRAKTRRRNRR